MRDRPAPVRFSRRDFVRTGVAALGATTLGCGSTDAMTAPTGPGDPRLSARPGTPTGTPTIGQSSLGLGVPRDGWLYVPTTYQPAVPTPLMVLLHGATRGAVDWVGYQARAEQHGLILLAPDSRESSWDLVRGGFGPDIDFIDAALAQTFDMCNVDPTRLLMGGFSDGASYGLSVGVANGDLFSHLIGFSPGFLFDESTVGRPRVFVSHGVADTILSVNASRDRIVPGLQSDGYDVTYFEFDGAHEIPAGVADAALDWFQE